MTATAVLGRPLWYELMTSDMSGAETFYKAAVGWATTPFDGAGMPYTMWMREGDVPVGGVMALPADLQTRGVPPHWLAYIGVERLEDAVAHVEKLGGSVLSPVIEVPDVGRMRVVKDPQGAAFALYQPSNPPVIPEGPGEVGDVSWLELYTTDSEAAMKFYGDLFGWKATESMDMGPMGVYRMFGRSHGSLGGMMTKTPDMAQVPNAWLLYFRVPDIAAATERVKANGGAIVNGPMEVPGGDLIVQCTDPQGGMFALHGKKA
jgi:uncharacterized protein